MKGVRGRSSSVESWRIWLLDLRSFVGEGEGGLDSLVFFSDASMVRLLDGVSRAPSFFSK